MKVGFKSFMCLGAAGLLAGILGLTGCSSTSGSRTSGQQKSDRQVAKEVKKQLEQDPTYKYPNVEATAYHGTVQLSGFAQTPGQRQRAADLAAGVKGANQVINDILLQPTPTGRAPIQDPLGAEAGLLLTKTNAPTSQPANAPSSEANPQPSPQEQNSPKQ